MAGRSTVPHVRPTGAAAWLTSASLCSLLAAATSGVVTARRKDSRTVKKKNTRLLKPAAPSGRVPRLPTIAAADAVSCRPQQTVLLQHSGRFCAGQDVLNWVIHAHSLQRLACIYDGHGWL